MTGIRICCGVPEKGVAVRHLHGGGFVWWVGVLEGGGNMTVREDGNWPLGSSNPPFPFLIRPTRQMQKV